MKFKTKIVSTDVNSLVTDEPGVQRKFMLAWANTIASNFNPDEFDLSTIHACLLEDGKRYSIVDGQHRVAALKILGQKTVKIKAYYGTSRQDRAKLFLRLNKHRVVSRVSKYLVAITARESWALEIEAAARSAGMRVNPLSTGTGTFSCVAALESAWRQLGGELGLTRCLRLIIASFGKGEGRDGHLVRGVATILKLRGEDVDDATAVAKWSRTPFVKLERDVAAIRAQTGWGPQKAWSQALLDVYNKRTKNKLSLVA